MARFSDSGADMYICQGCGKDLPSDTHPPTWVQGKGNLCPTCAQPAPMSLHEHCRIESGGLTGPALERYIHRYYGHG